MLVVLLYGISDSSVKCEVKCPYSPKVLFSFGMDFFFVPLFEGFAFLVFFVCF